MKQKIIFLFISILLTCSTFAQANDSLLVLDESVNPSDTSQVKMRSSFLKQWWEGIAKGNVDRTFEKKVDLTFAASPYYSQESGVGIGGQLSALYRTDRTDSLMNPSDFSFMGGGSTSGTYSIGIQGNNNFTRNHRLSYSLVFRRQVFKFWGITFEDCDKNHYSNVKNNSVQFKADYQQRVYGNWFLGAALRFDYVATEPDSVSYLHGQNKDGVFTGLGALLQYDSRDYPLNAQRGLYFLFREVYYPSALGRNKDDVYSTTVQFNAYHKLWKGAILAYDIFGEFNTSYDFVPWQLREKICADDRRMRGYYSGCYTDDNQICAQLELRQHIWKRFGAVAWGGAGSLFHNFTEISTRHILPSFGFGIRFEMKHRTNIRMDFGFGREAFGVAFGFAEAF